LHIVSDFEFKNQEVAMKRKGLILTAVILLTCFNAPGAFSAHNNQLSALSADADPHTGIAAMPVPVAVPQGRGGIQPSIMLIYNSHIRNDLLGAGWALELGSIERSTKKGVPQYDGTDTFVLRQTGAMQELVPVGGGEFRAKFEGAFAKISYENLGKLKSRARPPFVDKSYQYDLYEPVSKL